MDFSQDNFDYAGPKQGKETSLSWDFIKHISNDATSNPKVLLTHIPLYRPDDTPCGSHRSSSVINQVSSLFCLFITSIFRYQNYLSEETSNHLLDLIRPTLVLSGHDHDQCTVVHPTPAGTVTEHTVGTVSWQQGNLYPSFMLLSARSNLTNSEDAVSTNLCFLPMQTHIYIWYLTQFVITLILIIMWPTNGLGLSDKCMSYIRAMKNNLMATSKEKDEEENCEYEMVWDADGSMHLVKNARTRVPGPKSDTGFTGRRKVVSRPTAKKHLQEAEASVSVDLSWESKPEDTAKVQRPSKSKVRTLVQRLFRLRLLVIVAAVNVPLYMMLLFKDWIDR
ncbi:Calcineurin-like phosphoesterase [Musa troglodytarum]|uniref:Calcineurin-like phosphoesterase n=1 Tax=Musa troglodytarum TaxID=320322 RepID=A0A9E7I371_9LILI|nr:Calcineurin-like phosphoesterase [Musa troglodytarum]